MHLTQPAQNHYHLRLTLQWSADLETDGQDEVWSALIIWCEKHGAHLGGTPHHASVLIRPNRARLHSRLAKWLARQPGIAKFELAPVAFTDPRFGAGSLQSNSAGGTVKAQDLPAIVEALAQCQHYLLEEMQWCVDMLPQFRIKGLRSDAC